MLWCALAHAHARWLQVSILRLFLQILSDAPFRKQPASAEVLNFAVGIVRRVLARLVPKVDAAEPAEQAEAAAAGEGEVDAVMHLQSPNLSELSHSIKLHGAGSGPLDSTGEAPCMEADAAQRECAAQDAAVVRKGLASMMFVELLFWKNARDCEEVREEYGWKVPLPSHRPLNLQTVLAGHQRERICHW
jgi:hypothetical protein